LIFLSLCFGENNPWVFAILLGGSRDILSLSWNSKIKKIYKPPKPLQEGQKIDPIVS